MPDCNLPSVGTNSGCPRRLLKPLTGDEKMTKQNTQKQPILEGRITESYLAPKPTGKGRIIGLDCHPDTFTAAVFEGTTPHNAIQVESRNDMSLCELMEWARQFSREDLFLLEAGSNSFEICRRLRALGVRAVVLESCHVGKQAKTYADNDKMAAARIALVYLQGNAPCVWQPDALSCERRELLHLYNNGVSDHVAAINSLKGYLNQFAIRIGKRDLNSAATRQWISKQREWTTLQQNILEQYFTNLAHCTRARRELFSLIAQQVCAEPLMLRCMKLLGIGTVNAFALLAIIGDVRRFERPEKLIAYIGLNPGQRQSGTGKHIRLGTGKRGRGDLRNLLIQGAHAVLRAGRHTPLGKWGWKLFARKGSRNVAVSAVARKLLVQVWHLLWGNPPTTLEPDKSQATKFQKLMVTLGKTLRAKLGMPSSLQACVAELQNKTLLNPPPLQPA